MSRIVSVWLPAWPIDRLRRQSPARVPGSEPFALVEKGPHGLRITAANAEALHQGVVVGASLADVRAALPALAHAPAEPARDRRALLELADWLGRYGPARNVDGDDGAWVDVSGVPHLFGGEEALCADLSRRLAGWGITARIGLADTLGAAHALARLGPMPPRARTLVSPPGAAGTSLAGLSVSALRLDADAVRLLHRLGLKRIGQLYGLPRAALAARFRDHQPARLRKTAATTAAALLLRLDQALGLVAEPRPPLTPPPEAASRLAFPEPLLTAEGLASALEHLSADLACMLARQDLGGRRFRLSLYRSDGTTARALVGTSTPCRDASHIRRLLAEKLDRLDAGFGIDVVTLEAARLEPLAAHQTGLASATPASPAGLVDRLAGRLGAACVLLLKPTASHIPERAERWQPALEAPAESEPTHASPASPVSPAALRATAPRPCLMLPRPEPISVIAEIPDGAPLRFVWRRLSRRITRSEGPERIAPEWWLHIASTGPPPLTRDYYRLEDATGARYWVFREGVYGPSPETGDEDESEDQSSLPGSPSAPSLPRWFMHGLFP